MEGVSWDWCVCFRTVGLKKKTVQGDVKLLVLH